MIPVTIASDKTIPVIVPHAAFWIPPVPTMFDATAPHGEIGVRIAWSPGAGSHKLTSNVFHQSCAIAQSFHDCGNYIPHACLPPHNVLLAFHVPWSKRKVFFSASTVRMNGLPGALTGPLPLLNCADPCSLPMNFAVTSVTNTVYLGATLGDFIGGLMAMAAQMAFEYLIHELVHAIGKVGKKLPLEFRPLVRIPEKAAMLALKYVIYFFQIVPAVKDKWTEQVDGLTSSATMTTSSPFGDATVALSQSPDGTVSASTTSPGADGEPQSRSHGPIGKTTDAIEPPGPSALDRLFAGAPAL